jgi:hypothetical protein
VVTHRGGGLRPSFRHVVPPLLSLGHSRRFESRPTRSAWSTAPRSHDQLT